MAAPPSPHPSPSCPSRACASRPRCRPRRSRSASRQAARALGRNLRVPGFRAGKAPAPVVIKRIGREAVLDEAVRDSIGAWYSAAIDDAAIVPVGEPRARHGRAARPGPAADVLDRDRRAPDGQARRVQGARGRQARARAPSDEAVDAEVERLRERSGRLETVERAAAEGDFVVMDYMGTLDGEPFAGGEGRDQMIELGSGRLVPGFEEQLTGADRRRGAHRRGHVPRRLRRRGARRQARPSSPSPSRRSRRRSCPTLDDDLAAEAGFDTLDELRDDIRERLSRGRGAPRSRPSSARRCSTPPSPTRRSTCPTRWSRRARASCGTRCCTRSRTRGSRRRCTCRSPAAPRTTSSPRARRTPSASSSARPCSPRSSRPRAIEPSEDEVLEALEEAAPSESTSAKKLLERMKSAGRLDAFKAELAQPQGARPAGRVREPDHASSRRRRATSSGRPAADAEERSQQLWTPGS